MKSFKEYLKEAITEKTFVQVVKLLENALTLEGFVPHLIEHEVKNNENIIHFSFTLRDDQPRPTGIFSTGRHVHFEYDIKNNVVRKTDDGFMAVGLTQAKTFTKALKKINFLEDIHVTRFGTKLTTKFRHMSLTPEFITSLKSSNKPKVDIVPKSSNKPKVTKMGIQNTNIDNVIESLWNFVHTLVGTSTSYHLLGLALEEALQNCPEIDPKFNLNSKPHHGYKPLNSSSACRVIGLPTQSLRKIISSGTYTLHDKGYSSWTRIEDNWETYLGNSNHELGIVIESKISDLDIVAYVPGIYEQLIKLDYSPLLAPKMKEIKDALYEEEIIVKHIRKYRVEYIGDTTTKIIDIISSEEEDMESEEDWRDMVINQSDYWNCNFIEMRLIKDHKEALLKELK